MVGLGGREIWGFMPLWTLGAGPLFRDGAHAAPNPAAGRRVHPAVTRLAVLLITLTLAACGCGSGESDDPAPAAATATPTATSESGGGGGYGY